MERKNKNDRQMQCKATLASIEMKDTGSADVLHIRAYALAFGNVDSWGDIIAPGAVDAFLKSEDYGRMALCYQHDTREVIGVITDAGVDEKGMWIEADVLPTTTGKDVQTLIKARAVKEFSIGYFADEYHFEKRDGYMQDIRILDAITIVEVSPVTRAANDKAVLIDAKRDDITNPKTQDIMPEKDIMELKQSAVAAQAEAKAAKDAADAAQKALETAQAELKEAQEAAKKQSQDIDNLDASIKAQQAVIETMKKSMKENKKMTFGEAVKAALEVNKERIEKMFAEKSAGASIRMDVKLGTAGVTATAYGTQVDPVVGSAPHVARAFLAAFGEEVVAGDKAAWLDGTFTNAADYVDELAAAKDSDATATEVVRQFGKIATRLLLSSELRDYMTEIASWAQGEAVEFINDKVDEEVWKGAGSPSAQRKIYGLKGQATAFAKVGTYANAHVGDVILDAVAQAKKNGYIANVAIVSFATEAELKGIKDANGNYIYNQLTGMYGPVRILPSAVIGESEILVADSRCARILRRPAIELEITRDADLDGWKVNIRKAVQTKVKEAHKKGLIYVADKETAVQAITKA